MTLQYFTTKDELNIKSKDMPITKQAIKRMKQDEKRTARNKHYGNHMKSMIKLILGYIKKGEANKANKILPKVVSAIDVAAKKKLIHKNNASHKKSLVQRALAKPPAEEKAKAVKGKKKEEKVEKVDEVVEEKIEKVDEIVEEKAEKVEKKSE